MADQIRHRGPDDEGIWMDKAAGLGFAHRRLAIVDVTAAGHQPMHSRNGRLVLNFNGEVFNHLEIRQELQARGYTPEGGWRGHSDTETLLEAIAAWGLNRALERCVGQFAFALWDRRERILSLVRDRFGEKPLYYGWIGKALVFASELKAIRAHPMFQAVVDRQAVQLFAERGYIPAPLSIYRGIYKLPPGCVITLDATRSAPLSEPPHPGLCVAGVSLERYWDYAEVVREGLAAPITDEVQAVDELEAALATSVTGQSMADVPVGAFLSGGIDSSAVVAVYQKHSSQPVRTFTIGFAERGFNEAEHARTVARHLRTDHREMMVTAAEAREVIPELPAMFDEPFADSSQIPTHLVSRFAKSEVTVALSGDGGDELFGGYNRHVGIPKLWSQLQSVPSGVRPAIGRAAGLIPANFWNRAGSLAMGRDLPAHFGVKVRKSFHAASAAGSVSDLLSRFLDEWREDGSPVVGAVDVASVDRDLDGPAPAAVRIMYADAVGYLPNDVLCKVDRASMAISLETRAPFLDHRLAAVAARIPVDIKIRGGKGKHVLREMLYRYAPRELFERPKAGFAIPVGEWLKGPLRGWAEDLLNPEQLRSEGWFDAGTVIRRWRDHLVGRQDSTAAIWSILMFQSWLREGRSAK